MFAPFWPQRTWLICVITARGSTFTSCFIRGPFGSAKGPNVSGTRQPSTCLNHDTAVLMFGAGVPKWSTPSRPGKPRPPGLAPTSAGGPHFLAARFSFCLPAGLRTDVGGVPQLRRARLLVSHAGRVRDELNVEPERCSEVVDRLPGRRPAGHRERTEVLLHTLPRHVRNCGLDVADVERDMVAGDVGVQREALALVRRRVLEELDARTCAAAHEVDLLDHGARMHADEIRHQRALRIGERPEAERRRAAHDVHEPVARLLAVRDGDPHVIDAEHSGHRRGSSGDARPACEQGDRDDRGDRCDCRDRQPREVGHLTTLTPQENATQAPTPRRMASPAVVDDFKAFLLRGNVVDLAVGVVIGLAFGAVIAAFVADLLTPLIAAIFGSHDFSALTFTINGSVFRYGDFLNAVIAFLTVAAAVFFFVVRPVNALMARRKTEPPVDETTRNCPECLSGVPVDARRCAFCTSVIAG